VFVFVGLLLALLLAGSSASSTASSAMPQRATAPGAAQVRFASLDPVVVRGARFRHGERVRVLLVASRKYVRVTRTSRSGAFAVTFASVSVDRCSSAAAFAVGAAGDRAAAKVMAYGCLPPARTPGA
jgi:hypothetical protein